MADTTPAGLEPFKGPFVAEHDGQIWRVLDDRGEVVAVFDWDLLVTRRIRAQWLCNALNAAHVFEHAYRELGRRATPMVDARAAAEEIWQSGDISTALASAYEARRKLAIEKIAAIIAKHFSTPAQPAPAEGSREAFEREAVRLGLSLQRHSRDVGPYRTGDYADNRTKSAWHFWQCATSFAPAILRVAAEEIADDLWAALSLDIPNPSATQREKMIAGVTAKLIKQLSANNVIPLRDRCKCGKPGAELHECPAVQGHDDRPGSLQCDCCDDCVRDCGAAWQAAQGDRAGLTDIQADSAYANGMQVVLAAWAQCLTGETPDAFRKMQTILETRRAEIIEARLTGAKP